MAYGSRHWWPILLPIHTGLELAITGDFIADGFSGHSSALTTCVQDPVNTTCQSTLVPRHPLMALFQIISAHLSPLSSGSWNLQSY